MMILTVSFAYRRRQKYIIDASLFLRGSYKSLSNTHRFKLCYKQYLFGSIVEDRSDGDKEKEGIIGWTNPKTRKQGSLSCYPVASTWSWTLLVTNVFEMLHITNNEADNVSLRKGFADDPSVIGVAQGPKPRNRWKTQSQGITSSRQGSNKNIIW